MKLRAKLILTITILIALSVATIGFFAYESLSYQQEETQGIVSGQLEVAGLAVNQHLVSYESGLTLIGKASNFVNQSSNSLDEGKINTQLKHYLATYPDLISVYFASSDKAFYIQPETDLPEGYDPTARPWYINASANKAFTWSQVYTDAFTGQAILSAALPVYSDSDQLLGVLGFDMHLASLMDELSQIRIGETGYAFLTDNSGQVILHPNPELSGMMLPIPELESYFGNDTVGYTQYRWQGADKIAHINNVKNLNWKVIAVLDMEQSTWSLQQLVFRLMYITPILILMGIFAANGTARKFDRDKGQQGVNQEYDPFA